MMKNLNMEFWCIVSYVGTMPFYYTGYYGDDHGVWKPAVSSDFCQAMKLHEKEEADRINAHLDKKDWTVEEHAYFEFMPAG